jgi:CBS domain-containing protein
VYVSEIMTPVITSVEAEQTIQDAAELMRSQDIGALPVCDQHHVVGFLTDRDLAVRAVATGRDPGTTLVRDVMSRGVVSCYEDDEVAECARLMEAHKVRRVVVLNGSDRLAGIVSVDDLAVRLEQPAVSGQVLDEISRPLELQAPGDL